MLAWLYVSTGRPAEASKLIAAQLQSAAVWDPFLVYSHAERFKWGEFIGRLRQELRE
jgi:hypothetical protein